MTRLKNWVLVMWTLLPLCGLGQQWLNSRESTTLRSVVAGDFGFIAGGGPSTEALIRSSDGVQWTKVPLDTTRTIQSIANGLGPNGQPYFVAVDASGVILRSVSPAGPWIEVTKTRVGLNRVASRGSVVVACGQDGLLLESVDDGVSWKEVPSPAPGKTWRFLVADGGSRAEGSLWAGFLMLAEDGTAACRDLAGRWVTLAPLGSMVPISGVEWFDDTFWVFGDRSPVSWAGRFIAEDMPISLWVSHVLPPFQSSARYRAVAGLAGQAWAFGDSGLFRYGPADGFPGLENLLLPGESVGNFTDASAGRFGIAAVTDAGQVFRLLTNTPPKPEVTVTIRPSPPRISEGEMLFLDLDILAPGKVVSSVHWRLNGQTASGGDPRVPSTVTGYLKLSATAADSGVYTAEVLFADGTRAVSAAGVEVRVAPRADLVWTPLRPTGGLSNILTGLAVTRDRWILGGDNGLSLSTDGIQWSGVSSIDRPVYWLERINGVCFAVGQSLIARSENGLGWVKGTAPTGASIDGEFYGVLPWGGGYLAFGAKDAVGGLALSSADGLTWTPNPRLSGPRFWFGGATDGRALVLGGQKGGIRRCLPDGSIQDSSIASGEDIYSMASFRGRFLAITQTGKLWTSTDGVAWMLQRDLGFDTFVFRHRGPLLFILGINGNGMVWTTDGENWTPPAWTGTAPDPVFADVLLVDGAYRLVGLDGVVGVSQNVGDVELPVVPDPVVRQPAAGSPSARVEIPVLSPEAVTFQWWLDGAVVDGVTGSVLEIPTTGWSREGQIWVVVRWSGGSHLVGPVRIVPAGPPRLELSLNAPGGLLPAGSDLWVKVRGVTVSGGVRIRLAIDLNQDGRRQPDEPVIESFVVQEGVLPTVGGVRDPGQPGDEDGRVNGVVDCRIRWSVPTEFESLPLPYLVECEHPGASDSSVVLPLRTEDRTYSQGVEGVVVDSGTGFPISSAVVVVVQPETLQPISAVLTDRFGRYRLACPSGGYWIFALRDGYVAPVDSWAILGGEAGGDSLVLPGCYTSRELRLRQTDAVLQGRAVFGDGSSVVGEELVLVFSSKGVAVGQIGPGGTWRSRVTGGDWFVYNPVLGAGRMGRLTVVEGLAQSRPFTVLPGATLSDAVLHMRRPDRLLRVSVTGPGSRPLPGTLVYSVPTDLGSTDPATNPPWSAWGRSDSDGIVWLGRPSKDQWVGGHLISGSQWLAATDTNRFLLADTRMTQGVLDLGPRPRPVELIRVLDIDLGCCGWPRMTFGTSFDMEFEVDASTDLLTWTSIASGSTSGQVGSFVDGDSVLWDRRFYRIRRRGAPASVSGVPGMR